MMCLIVIVFPRSLAGLEVHVSFLRERPGARAERCILPDFIQGRRLLYHRIIGYHGSITGSSLAVREFGNATAVPKWPRLIHQ